MGVNSKQLYFIVGNINYYYNEQYQIDFIKKHDKSIFFYSFMIYILHMDDMGIDIFVTISSIHCGKSWLNVIEYINILLNQF